MTRGAWLGLAATAGVAVALVARWGGDHAPPPARVAAPGAAVPQARHASAARDAEPPRGLAPSLPRSLAGTEPDGALVVDAQGRFVPGPDAIDLFDYYLSAQGEESLAQIRERVRAAIRERLSGEAADAAEALLDAYLSYREEAGDLFAGDVRSIPLERRIQRIRELRRRFFGVELARELFGAEEERWLHELERQRVALDPDLGPDERARRLAGLDQELPAEERATRDAALAALRLRRDEARLAAEGAGPEAIQALRTERFGAEAAARLAALDAEREAWKSRVERYRAERDAALAQAAPEERGAILAELRARHFSSGERVRIEALDRIESGATTARP